MAGRSAGFKIVLLDHWVAACLVPLAIWILVSGLDDLFIDLVFFRMSRSRFGWPASAELDQAPQRRIAILVPLWHEDRVVGPMLEHNLEVIGYRDYDVFVGVYPNDPLTAQAVEGPARRYPRVHIVECPHDGPTSKGDCLNCLYRGMEAYESRHGVRFDVIVTHDAEDLIHPEELRLINWFSRDHEMVQVPVLPLATGLREFTHGIYCDEFAEYQLKDIPVRHRLGGFLPSNGVGTGFAREALERLAEERGGLAFDPESLTEDYENGYYLHVLGFRQVFVPIRFSASLPMATREYFPRNFRAAVRQRSRWVTGIVLQGWQRHGWRVDWRQVYWFWRDRKGLVGNLLSPSANAAFFYGLATYLWALSSGETWHFGNHIPTWLSWFYDATLGISLVQITVRVRCSALIYGWRFAYGVPVRIVWANLANCAATVVALHQFLGARAKNRALVWRKTEHVYPVIPALNRKPQPAARRPRGGAGLQPARTFRRS